MDTITIPAPGTIGIGVGRVIDGEFLSIIWYPLDARQEAEEMVNESEGHYELREGVAL